MSQLDSSSSMADFLRPETFNPKDFDKSLEIWNICFGTLRIGVGADDSEGSDNEGDSGIGYNDYQRKHTGRYWKAGSVTVRSLRVGLEKFKCSLYTKTHHKYIYGEEEEEEEESEGEGHGGDKEKVSFFKLFHKLSVMKVVKAIKGFVHILKGQTCTAGLGRESGASEGKAALKRQKKMPCTRKNMKKSKHAVNEPSLDPEDEIVDETGLDPHDITLVEKTAGVTRSKAAKALKDADGDIAMAILSIVD